MRGHPLLGFGRAPLRRERRAGSRPASAAMAAQLGGRAAHQLVEPVAFPVNQSQLVGVEPLEELVPGDGPQRPLTRESREIDAEYPGIVPLSGSGHRRWIAVVRFGPPSDLVMIGRRAGFLACHVRLLHVDIPKVWPAPG